MQKYDCNRFAGFGKCNLLKFDNIKVDFLDCVAENNINVSNIDI